MRSREQRSPKSFRLLVLGLACLLAGPSLAATWRVERDGSGDFVVIQDALDQAATGDSILIGPGEFPELRTHQFPLVQFDVAMLPEVSDLTIIGAGKGLTVVGRPELTEEVDGRETAGLIIGNGVLRTRIEELTIRHLKYSTQINEAIEAVDCSFEAAGRSHMSLSDCDGVRLEHCDFVLDERGADAILSFFGGSNPNFTARDCTFTGAMGFAIQLQGGAGATLENCVFDGPRLAVELSGATATTITNCTFRNTEAAGLILKEFSEATLRHCRFTNGLYSGARFEGSRVVVDSCYFGGAGNETIWTAGLIKLEIRNSDILNGGGLSLRVHSQQEFTERLDLRHNYWGTTDSLQIAEWIDDANDDDPCVGWYCPRSTAEFYPFLGSPVPVQSESFGGLKARFGGR